MPPVAREDLCNQLHWPFVPSHISVPQPLVVHEQYPAAQQADRPKAHGNDVTGFDAVRSGGRHRFDPFLLAHSTLLCLTISIRTRNLETLAQSLRAP